MTTTTTERPWENLKEILAANDAERLKRFLDQLSPAETAWGISRITPLEQGKFLILPFLFEL